MLRNRRNTPRFVVRDRSSETQAEKYSEKHPLSQHPLKRAFGGPVYLSKRVTLWLFGFIGLLTSSAAMATAPSVTGDTITWDGTDWYQVQDASSYQTICEGGTSCQVPAGRYVVINHTTGERFDGIQIGPQVSGLTISWPADGWYEVQSMSDNQSVCSGGSSCTVMAGTYVVINHDASIRWSNITVENAGPEAPPSGGSGGEASGAPTVDGDTISWSGDDWFEVQSAEDYSALCEGGNSCTVPTGVYNVINHTSGIRYDDVSVGSAVMVSGNTISWLGSDWHQVLNASSFESMCEGGNSCDVEDGEYIVVNLTTGQRYEDVLVSGGATVPDNNAPAPDPNAPTNTSFVGSWQSECRGYPLLDSSERHILAIDESKVVQDFYNYDGVDCEGVPRGASFPLRIYTYSLGEDIVTSNGLSASAIDLEITQVSEVGTLRDGATLGQQRFGLVAVDPDGNLRFTDGSSTSVDNRPTEFESFGQSFVPRVPISVSVNSIDDFIGNYRSGCELRDEGNSSYSTLLVTTSTEDTIDDFFLNPFCVGESQLQLRTPTTIDPQAEGFTTFFGDPALSVYVADAAQEVVYGEDLLAFDLRAARERYTLFSLAAGNTLMRGDCVVREETCKTSPDYYADMIDLEFNSTRRYRQIEDPYVFDTGNSDTAAIAGLWDFSSPDNGDYFYQLNRADGTSAYYEVVGDGPDAVDACLQTYDETLTAYGDNVYAYIHDSEAAFYEFYARQFVEGGVLVQVDPESDERLEYSALESLPALPDC